MRESMRLTEQLGEAIDEEIAARIEAHQGEIARVRAARPAAPAARRLVLLAHGDSWFDYPLAGNLPSFSDTDVIAKLRSLGEPSPLILNLSHWGEATTEEMSLPKQRRMIEALRDPRNWLDADKPDAILFSGGGNDIAGDQFCIFLNYAAPRATGLDPQRFQEALGIVEASYRALFLFRDRYAPGAPIFAHCYDVPIPNGVHPPCAGPWLRPSLEQCGWDLEQGEAIARDALVEFKGRLLELAAEPANDFTLVDTQGVLGPADWANELHPHPDGFRAIAEKFVAALRARFPQRI